MQKPRAILGAVILNNYACFEAAQHLKPEDLSLDSPASVFNESFPQIVEAVRSLRIDRPSWESEYRRRKTLCVPGNRTRDQVSCLAGEPACCHFSGRSVSKPFRIYFGGRRFRSRTSSQPRWQEKSFSRPEHSAGSARRSHKRGPFAAQ